MAERDTLRGRWIFRGILGSTPPHYVITAAAGLEGRSRFTVLVRPVLDRAISMRPIINRPPPTEPATIAVTGAVFTAICPGLFAQFGTTTRESQQAEVGEDTNQSKRGIKLGRDMQRTRDNFGIGYWRVWAGLLGLTVAAATLLLFRGFDPCVHWATRGRVHRQRRGFSRKNCHFHESPDRSATI